MVSVSAPRQSGKHGFSRHRRAVLVLAAVTLLAFLQLQGQEGDWVVLDPTLVQSASRQLIPDFLSTISSSSSYTQIRRWGCKRQEAPFIFVHIGKAGGGSVRARMAASALDYERENWKRHLNDSAYYPILDAKGTMHMGRFYTSDVTNFIPDSMIEFHGDFGYEGHSPCTATTPLGQAIACPLISEVCGDYDEDGSSDNRCDAVYMGHNLLGSELHWLPTSFLVEWWRSTKWAESEKNDFMEALIQNRFAPNQGTWQVPQQVHMIESVQIPTVECPKSPELSWKYGRERFLRKCLKPREPFVDGLTRDYITSTSPEPAVIQYAQMIASLPVMRVTILRDPFSWLVSKFFWHDNHYSRNKAVIGPDLGKMNARRRRRYLKLGKEYPRVVKCDDLQEATAPDGWASIRAWTYLFYLCGEHCAAGYASGSMTLEEMELQAAYNLRNSFAVVGLLEDTDMFYEMVSQRVDYMDTSLNPHVDERRHGSGGFPEAERCKEVYADPNFQRLMATRSPVIAALARLHQIGVEVNQFQKEELAQCSRYGE
eukprot:Nitzschia sp. Nitz4//scaffold93_size78505//42440//44062//NITZ4_005423-RA/size78505-processed-gene-0.88-mRNA-1//1//CDS//3329560297//5154//frame0